MSVDMAHPVLVCIGSYLVDDWLALAKLDWLMSNGSSLTTILERFGGRAKLRAQWRRKWAIEQLVYGQLQPPRLPRLANYQLDQEHVPQLASNQERFLQVAVARAKATDRLTGLGSACLDLYECAPVILEDPGTKRDHSLLSDIVSSQCADLELACGQDDPRNPDTSFPAAMCLAALILAGGPDKAPHLFARCMADTRVHQLPGMRMDLFGQTNVLDLAVEIQSIQCEVDLNDPNLDPENPENPLPSQLEPTKPLSQLGQFGTIALACALHGQPNTLEGEFDECYVKIVREAARNELEGRDTEIPPWLQRTGIGLIVAYPETTHVVTSGLVMAMSNLKHSNRNVRMGRDQRRGYLCDNECPGVALVRACESHLCDALDKTMRAKPLIYQQYQQERAKNYKQVLHSKPFSVAVARLCTASLSRFSHHSHVLGREPTQIRKWLGHTLGTSAFVDRMPLFLGLIRGTEEVSKVEFDELVSGIGKEIELESKEEEEATTPPVFPPSPQNNNLNKHVATLAQACLAIELAAAKIQRQVQAPTSRSARAQWHTVPDDILISWMARILPALGHVLCEPPQPTGTTLSNLMLVMCGSLCDALANLARRDSQVLAAIRRDKGVLRGLIISSTNADATYWGLLSRCTHDLRAEVFIAMPMLPPLLVELLQHELSPDQLLPRRARAMACLTDCMHDLLYPPTLIWAKPPKSKPTWLRGTAHLTSGLRSTNSVLPLVVGLIETAHLHLDTVPCAAFAIECSVEFSNALLHRITPGPDYPRWSSVVGAFLSVGAADPSVVLPACMDATLTLMGQIDIQTRTQDAMHRKPPVPPPLVPWSIPFQGTLGSETRTGGLKSISSSHDDATINKALQSNDIKGEEKEKENDWRTRCVGMGSVDKVSNPNVSATSSDPNSSPGPISAASAAAVDDDTATTTATLQIEPFPTRAASVEPMPPVESAGPVLCRTRAFHAATMNERDSNSSNYDSSDSDTSEPSPGSRIWPAGKRAMDVCVTSIVDMAHNPVIGGAHVLMRTGHLEVAFELARRHAHAPREWHTMLFACIGSMNTAQCYDLDTRIPCAAVTMALYAEEVDECACALARMASVPACPSDIQTIIADRLVPLFCTYELKNGGHKRDGSAHVFPRIMPRLPRWLSGSDGYFNLYPSRRSRGTHQELVPLGRIVLVFVAVHRDWTKTKLSMQCLLILFLFWSTVIRILVGPHDAWVITLLSHLHATMTNECPEEFPLDDIGDFRDETISVPVSHAGLMECLLGTRICDACFSTSKRRARVGVNRHGRSNVRLM